MESVPVRKRCGACHQIKEIEHFCKLDKKYSKDGFNSICRQCDHIRGRRSYFKNIEVNREKRKQWQDNNHDKHLQHVANYRARKKAQKQITEIKTTGGSDHSGAYELQPPARKSPATNRK